MRRAPTFMLIVANLMGMAAMVTAMVIVAVSVNRLLTVMVWMINVTVAKATRPGPQSTVSR